MILIQFLYKSISLNTFRTKHIKLLVKLNPNVTHLQRYNFKI